jgi:hypothetical protein
MSKAAWNHIEIIAIQIASSLLVTHFLYALRLLSPGSSSKNLYVSPDGMRAIPEYTTANDRN